MEKETYSFLKAWLIILISLSYCYFIVSKFPHPKQKLLFLLPIFTIFTILPLTLSTILPTGLTAFFITWLASFKLLLFAFNHGPLSHQSSSTTTTITQCNPTNAGSGEGEMYATLHQSSSFLHFILLSAFPIKIKKNPCGEITKIPPKVLPLGFWSKTVIFSILVGICDIYKGRLNNFFVFVIYCCMLYLFIDMIICVANKVVGSTLGVELSPPSDEPYVATSLRDFWGRRWNLMVTDALRHTVYLPIRVFLSNYMGRAWATLLAMFVAFLVSGLMHELIYYYMARVSPTWEVTWFFVFQGLCVMLEVGLENVLGRKWRWHWAVSGPLTVGFVMGTGYLWFFPQLLRNQVDVRAIEEVKSLLNCIKGTFN